MKHSWLIYFFCVSAVFFMASSARAHEPRLVPDNQLVLIENPGVSQAFYGELKDREDYFLIELKQPGELYFQILVPDLPGILKDKTVVVEYMAALGEKAAAFARLEPDAVIWEKYYEEFAGDNYFKGPEISQAAEPGFYIVKVMSPDNTGKYVLAVGQKEEFGAKQAVESLLVLPRLKKDFFQEPITQWFNGKIGKYAGFGLLALIILGLMFFKFNQVYK